MLGKRKQQNVAIIVFHLHLPWWFSGKESVWDLWVGKIPWRRKCQPPPAFLPGGSHGQRILLGNSL